MQPPFAIGRTVITAGQRELIELPVSRMSNYTPVTLPVHVLHGASAGPAMFVTAAIHGDELNGVEIIRRTLRLVDPSKLCGTLLCVPVVNAYGFIGHSRYLPDRRDLNRSFPGSAKGSLAGRLAHILLSEVVQRCQIGIDLHTAAVHRVNLPQIRAHFDQRPRCRELSEAFGAAIALESPERPGSLRKAAREIGVDVLVYEGGEGLRFDEFAIAAGVDGITNVMISIGMLELNDYGGEARAASRQTTVFANSSRWVRSPEGGVLRSTQRIGDVVSEGDIIGHVANPYEDEDVNVLAPCSGLIIGRTTLPLVNMGDALFHIAWSEDDADQQPKAAPHRARVPEPVLDEDEIL
jgi:uncharacterized protein